MTPEAALAALRETADAGKADQVARYHKAPRQYLGVANPAIDAHVRHWRRTLPLEARLSLAAGLWRTDIHEARIAAAKLLTQTRVRPDDTGVWRLIAGWVPEFDAWAIADHASIAGQKRLLADPARLDEVEAWTRSGHMWTRRAAMVTTLPWARLRDPGAIDARRRERVLGWAASYLPDKDWFIQKAVAWWVRDLSKPAPERARAFLDAHGADMAPFARLEASRHLA